MKIKKLNESKLSFKQYDVNKKKLTESYNWNKEFDSELGRTIYDCGDINGLHCYIFSEEDDGDWGYTVFIKNGHKILRHKPFNHINIDEVKTWAEKEMTEWGEAINSQPLEEELWNSSRVTDLVKYYLDRSNVPTNTLAQRIMKQMKEEGSKLPSNTTDFYDTLYRAIDDYNSQFEDDMDEAFDVDKVQKRIARVDEFDNGHVIHNDWTRMSSQEAEEKAKQMSIENPDKVYYVKYDNVMEPCSDIKWKNGEQLTEDVPMEYTDTSNFKNLQDESDEYQVELKRKNTNRDLLHKIFDRYGLRTSDEKWADKVYWLFAKAQKITVVDDASKIPHKTNDGQKIRYVISTPNAEVDVHADVFEDYIWVVTKDSINESFEIDDEFWTKEELLDFADDVCAHINETFTKSYDTSEVYLTNGVIELTVIDDDGNEFSTNYKVDMRKVKRPSHIDRFVLPVAADLIQQIKDFDNNLSEDLSGKYSDKFKALVDKMGGEDSSLASTMRLCGILRDMIRYCKEDDLKDLWIEKDYDTIFGDDDKPLDEALDVRANTNKVIELAEEGIISWEDIARNALMYMSEWDVTDMASMYSWIEDEDDEDDEDDDDLYESFNEKDILHKLDQFQSSITVKSEDEKALKDLLRNKNISFKIDDSKEGKLKFKLNYKPLKEDFEGVPLMGPQEGPEAGMATLINTAIQDKFETIQSYNDLAVTARAEGFDDIAIAIDSLNTEENVQVGKLQDLLKTFSPNAAAIDNDDNTYTVDNGEIKVMEESGNSSNSPKEWAEQYHEINKLEDFVSDNLNDGTLTEDDLMKIAEESSTIEIDDMKRAINSYKNK